MRTYQLISFNIDSVTLQDTETLVKFCLPYSVMDQYKQYLI